MNTTNTRRAIELALLSLLRADGADPQEGDLRIAVTEHHEAALFAVVVNRQMRENLSRRLMQLTGRQWAAHWDVWVLSELDAQRLLAEYLPPQ
jgi:hypothetical protein